MGTRPFMPEPLSDAQKKLDESNREHLRLLDMRMKVLQPRARGGPASRLNIRLQIPTHRDEKYVYGEMPQVQADVLEEIGLDVSFVGPMRKRPYELTYFGYANREELDYALARGLAGQKGLVFQVGEEK